MKRTIKFRAWYNGWQMIPWERLGPAAFNDSEYVLMQFTGLEDKNGIDVYEGDILLIPVGCGIRHKFQIVWCDFYGGWGLAKQDGRSLNHTGWQFRFSEGGEVIGNIFQDPELLIEP